MLTHLRPQAPTHKTKTTPGTANQQSKHRGQTTRWGVATHSQNTGFGHGVK